MHNPTPNLNLNHMLRLAIIFLVIALIAGALGLGGVMDLSLNIAYILGIIGIVLLVIHLITGGARRI